jgi:hypothetical protein
VTHTALVALNSASATGEATRGAVQVQLTPLEFRLLAALVREAGRVLTHRQIPREVWGPGSLEQTHYVRVYMGNLRKKLERDPARPQHLLTEPGVARPLSASGPGWPPPHPSSTRLARRGGRQPSGMRSWIRPWDRAQRLMHSPERAGRRVSES